jgi:hypothetical protein
MPINAGQDNTNLDVASWQTCTNASAGFSFKYPATWRVQDNPYVNESPDASGCLALGDTHESVNIAIMSRADCSTLSDCAQQHPYVSAGEHTAPATLTPTSIGGVPALTTYLVRTDSGMWRYRVFYVLRDKTLLTIAFISEPGADAVSAQTAAAVMSAFTFGNSN